MLTLKNAAFLCIDEADRLVEFGHFREMDRIFEFIYGDTLHS